MCACVCVVLFVCVVSVVCVIVCVFCVLKLVVRVSYKLFVCVHVYALFCLCVL